MPQFAASSDDCELLLLLQTLGSVKAIANALHRDVSVVSRRIGHLGNTTPWVEKIDGVWQISNDGKRLNSWTSDALLSQAMVLKKQSELKIATTREFGIRLLSRQLSHIVSENTLVRVISCDGGVEQQILSGAADIGFACGRPQEPGIRFQRLIAEPFVIIASPCFVDRYTVKDLASLLNGPHLHHIHLSTSALLRLSNGCLNTIASFNDWSMIRECCLAHMGWAVVPRYTVCEELDTNRLLSITGSQIPTMEPEYYGIWWLKERSSIAPWVDKLRTWLSQQKL